MTSSIPEIIDDVFSVVNSRPEDAWARDFVMDNSPETILQVLANPRALPYAATLSASDICFQADSAMGGFFDYRFDVDALFIPSFCSGRICVGIIFARTVTKSIFEQDSPHTDRASFLAEDITLQDLDSIGCSDLLSQPANVNFRIGRFARDETTGRMLSIIHSCAPFCSSLNVTLVGSMQHISPTVTKRVALSCDTSRFFSGNIVDSVTLCMVKRFTRNCPVCSSAPNAQCRCSLAMDPPSHPFDFRSAARAVQLYSGNFRAGFGESKVVALHTAEVSPSTILNSYLRPLENCLAPSGDEGNHLHLRQPRKSTHSPVMTRSRVIWDSLNPGFNISNEAFGKLTASMHRIATQLSLSMIHPFQLTLSENLDCGLSGFGDNEIAEQYPDPSSENLECKT